MPRPPRREGTPDYIARQPQWQETKKYSRKPPDAKLLEAGKYYTAYVARDGQIYIYWHGTEKTSLHQWQEDLASEISQRRIPAWDRELDYVRNKYGMESSTVHHDGYSRGGSLAQHMGGIGYGSAYFPKYPPAAGAESRTAGDYFHDHIVPTVNEFAQLASSLIDVSPGEHPHTMDSEQGAFDSPVGPVVDPKGPRQMRPSADYSGFACAFVGFPAKIKYDRKRNIAHHSYNGRHIVPSSRKRKRLDFNDSAMRPRVDDTPHGM